MKFIGTNLAVVLLSVLATTQSRQTVVNFGVDQKDVFCKVAFKDCGSVVGKILGVSFNGTCSGQGFAILKKGTVVQIDFQFQAYHVESVLTSMVHGKIGVLPWVSFTLDNPDACKNSGLVCPIQANTTLDYKPDLRVLTEYPSINVLVKWELQNKDGVDVFCVVMPATISD